MRQHQYVTDLLAGLVITLFLAGGGHAEAALPGQPISALTVDEAIACLRTAVATQAGLVKEVEGDDETGKRFCEVKIADERGSAINSRSMCRPIRWLRPSKRPTEPGRCA